MEAGGGKILGHLLHSEFKSFPLYCFQKDTHLLVPPVISASLWAYLYIVLSLLSPASLTPAYVSLPQASAGKCLLHKAYVLPLPSNDHTAFCPWTSQTFLITGGELE